MIHTTPNTRAARAARATPVVPLTPRETVTDDTLRLLARGDAQRAVGIIDPEHHAILCAVLTDILGELLARRAAMKFVDARADIPRGRT